jgi:hypothetical protein
MPYQYNPAEEKIVIPLMIDEANPEAPQTKMSLHCAERTQSFIEVEPGFTMEEALEDI